MLAFYSNSSEPVWCLHFSDTWHVLLAGRLKDFFLDFIEFPEEFVYLHSEYGLYRYLKCSLWGYISIISMPWSFNQIPNGPLASKISPRKVLSRIIWDYKAITALARFTMTKWPKFAFEECCAIFTCPDVNDWHWCFILGWIRFLCWLIALQKNEKCCPQSGFTFSCYG